MRRRRDGLHELQRVHEDGVASFTLELRDGVARACRGWRYAMTNDGPEVHSKDRFRKQLGFTGRYRAHGGAIDVELERDDAVCAPIGEYTYAPARATSIRLTCVLATPDGHLLLTAPVLVCRWTSPPSAEHAAHVVDGLAADGTIVLGAAPGLEVTIEGTPPGMTELGPPSVTARIAPAPLGDGAWQR